MSQPDQSGQASSSTSVQFYPLPVNLPLPEKLEISSGTLVNNWRKFKRAWENYEVAAQLKDLKNPESNKERRAATLLTSLGSDALDILDGLAFDDETQRKNPDAILARLEQYCIGEVNESFERYNFNKRDQEPHESIDAYVSSLRRLAKTCNYGQLTDSLIRDRIIAGIRDNTARKKLLQTQKLTLKQSIDIVRSFEVAGEQLKQMSTPEEVRLLHRTTTVQQAGKQRRQGVTVERSTSEQGGPHVASFATDFTLLTETSVGPGAEHAITVD